MPILFALGNPLLDIQVKNGEALLQKYKLKANDAILAEPEHTPLYDEISQSKDVTYVAGGAAQNAARGAAYIMPPNSVVYSGCVGDDELATKLREANAKEGVQSAYMVKPGEKTGACGVVLTGHYRSLVTTLRAAEKFEKSHLSTPEIAALINEAQFFYIGGFFLTHGVESALELAKNATAAGKVVALNLAAPFIPQFFKQQLETVLPYTDIIIGNDSEAEAWGNASGLPKPTDLASVAKSIAMFHKTNASRPRLVVLTAGAESTVLVSSSSPEEPKLFSVDKLTDEEIVDSNGAGDAFAGGFMGAYALGKPVDECIEVGHRMGAMNLRQIGPQFQWPKVQML